MKARLRRPKIKSSRRRGPAVGSHPKLPLTERVHAALKKDIISGVLRPGQAFTEKHLAHRYAASRTPVREAAVRLQEQGLVRIVPNRGYFVTQLSIQELNDVFEFRAFVESACAELLCTMKLSPKVLDELEAAAKFLPAKAEDFGTFIEVDTAFHVALARQTKNALLVRAVSQMRAQTERIMFVTAESFDQAYYGEFPAREHMAILHAITTQNADLARRLMREHIIGGKNRILDLARRDLRFLHEVVGDSYG